MDNPYDDGAWRPPSPPASGRIRSFTFLGFAMKKGSPGTGEGNQPAVVLEDRAGQRHMMTEEALREAIGALASGWTHENVRDRNVLRRCLERLRDAVASGAALGEPIESANEWQPLWTDPVEVWRKSIDESEENQ
jgi:hypothetical protein